MGQQQEQQQQGAAASLTNASGGGDTAMSCEPSENDVIHIVRYPDLDTRLLANNVTFDDDMTTDNILSYQLQKLQEVGYRSIQLVNSSDTRVNLTNPQTNETIATVPAKLVEMTYSTNFAPNETRTGYLISTATNATTPNPGTTKGYSIFYEGNSTNTTSATTAAEITTATTAASGSLLPPLLPPAVGQVIDSFELLAAPEVVAQEEAQTAETAVGGDFNEGDDNAAVEEEDDNGADEDDDDGGNGDDDGGNGDDDGGNGDDDGGNGDDEGGNGDDEGEGGGEGGEGEFEDCTIVGRGDPGDVGC